MKRVYTILTLLIFTVLFGLPKSVSALVCIETVVGDRVCTAPSGGSCPAGTSGREEYESCAAWEAAVQPPADAPINTEVGTPEGVVGGVAPAPGGGLIEPCALQDPKRGDANAYCNDVNDLLSQLIRIARYLFGIIGSLALLFFIYGGMTMILSFGSADKFKQGRDIMVAAVVGMMIAFSAYIVINFVLDALGVTSNFRGL